MPIPPGERYAEFEVLGGGRKGGREVNWKLSCGLSFGLDGAVVSREGQFDAEGESIIQCP